MIIIKHWELIKHLTQKEIKARYKQSFLGFFWVVLSPFFQMLIMSFIFSKVMRVNDLGVPYPVYLYAGLLPWLFFSNSLQNATEELVENASLIKKYIFPVRFSSFPRFWLRRLILPSQHLYFCY